MATSPTYQIDLSLTPATVGALVDGGYSLYAVFAVEMTNAAAGPTVGFATQSIMANMTIEWTADVSAYTSSSPITNGGLIRIGYETSIDPGQTFEVTAGGVGQVKTEGPSTKITIANTTAGPFTSGFARAVSGMAAAVPIFAVPLYGNQTNVAAPLPKVLLQLTTKTLRPGAVVERFMPKSLALASYNLSLLVTATESGLRKLSYDINTGWSWGHHSWAQTVPADANLTTLLIEPEETG